MKILIPVICGLLFMAGGREQWKWSFINQKIWRWIGIGLFLATVFAITQKSIIPLIVIATYFIATSALPYGDSSWLNKFVSKEVKYGIYGFCFGLSSAPILGIGLGLIQAVIGAIAFIVLMKLGEKNLLDQKFIEFGIGSIGTITLGV